jgi:signal transduction histidine kinase
MVLVFSSFPRPLKAAIIGVPAAGAALAALAGLVGGFNAADQWRLLLIPGCFVAVAVAERYPVKIGLEQKINLGALPCLVAVLLLPAGIGPATAALSVLVGNHLVGRSRPESVFNAGNTLAASAVAALVGAVGPHVDGMQEARAALGALLYAGVNLGLGVLPAALRSGRPYPELLKQAASATWPALLTLAACAVAISVLWIKAPLIAPLPLIVLPMIYRMNRAIEAQSKANEQLAGVLAAQRRFLTDVSHQVATPLATIMTNLSILRRANGSKSGVEDAVTDSVAEAERMKRMLERLRSLAHADEDVPLRRELVDLAELTADVVRAYAVAAATSGVELVADVGAHASVSADKDLLREAVANLVDNAVRVSPPGAHVTLSVERGSAGPVIAVADEGPGIEDDRLPRLFERFQRSDSGSGLGLAIARRVVERHGGTIRVKTARGAGSTFTIELPG